MITRTRLATALSALLALASPGLSQVRAIDPLPSAPPATVVPAATAVPDVTAEEALAESAWKKGRPITVQYLRPLDQRGINVFETPKEPGVAYTGFKFEFGRGLTALVRDLPNPADHIRPHLHTM